MELSERSSAAYAGKLLRRFGAEVVKIEPPAGDPMRRSGSRVQEAGGASTTAAFDYFNEGKTSRIVSDPSALAELVDGADALVLDLELPRLAAWGLTIETLGSLRCGVVAAISPFGLSGPYAGFAGPELVTGAFGGASVGIGEPVRAPLKMPLSQGAIQAGLVASIAIMGVLAGEDGRHGDRPTVIDISETDVWATVHTGTTLVAFLFRNRLRRRQGRRVLGQPYPHQLFRCKDGFIAVQASEKHQLKQFVEMVGSPAWLTDRRFGSRHEMNDKHADEIDRLLEPWFLPRTREEIFRECRERRIPAAPVRSIAEVRNDGALVERGCFESYRGATGVEVTAPRPPFRYRFGELAPSGPVPVLPETHDAP